MSGPPGGCSRSSPCTPGCTSATGWLPGSGPTSPDPRANLRTAVWVLRRSLGDDAVVATRATVALGPVTRDLDEIEALG